MKQSRMFVPTSKNVLKDDATSKSLAIMIKAGMIKQVAAGIYTYLPYANIILRKIENIVREELKNIDSVELIMPALQPKELWVTSGRWDKYGKELMRLHDRHDRDFCLGPTHEEVITSIIADHVKSWRALPLSLYQIQTKFRDELRPRFGLMRGREFIMKDAYSFHVDANDLDAHYLEMEQAYDNIFERCGLKVIKVSADNGAIGGSDSIEFMSVSEIGEDTLVYCESCGYQANLEKAIATYQYDLKDEPLKEIAKIATPNASSIEDVATLLNAKKGELVKNMVYIDDVAKQHYLVVCPGNYNINETKLINLVKANDLRLLTDYEMKQQGLVKGFIGPVNLKTNDAFIIVCDESIPLLINHCAGANEDDTHLINVNYPRDYNAKYIGDIKEVNENDLCTCSQPLSFAKGIEVGHIFKLGNTYSQAFNATYLDQNQKEVFMEMGCYGLGISRLLMACVENISSENKINWPKELQPFAMHIIIVDIKKEEQVNVANELYTKYTKLGYDVLLDDTHERAGSKFANADLMGVNTRIVVGKKASEGVVELLDLSTGIKDEVALDNLETKLSEVL